MVVALRSLLLAVTASMPLAVSAERGQPPEAVRDLAYGEVLFEFYQDNYSEALTRYLVAVEQGSLRHHADEAQLLAGGLYLANGQHDDAERIFDRLLETGAEVPVRQRARLELARSRYRRGQYQAALTSLGAESFDDANAEAAATLRAGAHLQLQDYDRAARLLNELEQTPQRAFALYNLGVAAAGMADLAAAVRYLAAAAEVRDVTTRRGWLPWRRRAAAAGEMPGLRDKARLALGMTLIRIGEPDAAVTALEGVDADSPFAAAALLGLGWAAAEQDDFELALNAWRALGSRDAADPAVQEAWFAVPYALGELGAHAEAAAQFEVSIGAIEKEDRALAGAIRTLREPGLAAVLLQDQPIDDTVAGWRLQRAPNHSLSRYLFALLADNRVQRLLGDYRDLAAMRQRLDQRRADLDQYSYMLGARSARFAAHAPQPDAYGGRRLAALRARAGLLRARTEAAADDADAVALATTREKSQINRLDEILRRAARLPAAQAAAIVERHRILAGTLNWRLSHEYAARLHSARVALAETDRLLAEAATTQAAVVASIDGVPVEIAAFEQRIAALGPRVATMQLRLDAVLTATDRRLAALAIDELESRRARLAQYLDQAHYALAAIYDRAAGAGGS